MMFKLLQKPAIPTIAKRVRILAVCMAASFMGGNPALTFAAEEAQPEATTESATSLIGDNSAISAETTGAIAPVVERKMGKSGLPLPRFASLKSNNINLRVGPGTENAILWTYVKAGLPVEILLEFENWRKIRDAEGVEGWVMQTMLSGRRTAIIEPGFAKRAGDITAIIEASASEPELTVPIFARPDDQTRRVALLEPGVNVDILTCDKDWCSVAIADHGGWIEKTRLWGVYSDEQIDD
jgi:SH3-like domain-containing protein